MEFEILDQPQALRGRVVHAARHRRHRESKGRNARPDRAISIPEQEDG